MSFLTISKCHASDCAVTWTAMTETIKAACARVDNIMVEQERGSWIQRASVMRGLFNECVYSVSECGR